MTLSFGNIRWQGLKNQGEYRAHRLQSELTTRVHGMEHKIPTAHASFYERKKEEEGSVTAKSSLYTGGPCYDITVQCSLYSDITVLVYFSAGILRH